MSRMRDERGVSMVLFALILPLILLMGVITIDVGNWWVHKRHLQTQVDAAVFAAGPEFVRCFDPASLATNEISQAALRYAGDTLRDSSTTNLQVQEPDDVRVALNSPRYWAQSDGLDTTTGYGLDYTADGDPVDPDLDPSDPCSAKFLDAKATDDEAPLLWGLIPFVASPKAHAKIEIKKLPGLSGFLPWAVPEVDPRTVAALFVDETDTNAVDRWAELDGPDDPQDTVTLNGETAAEWSGLGSVNVQEQNGVIVFTSRHDLDLDVAFLGKSLTQICAMPTASCYGGTTNTSGVGFIRGTPKTDPGNTQVVLNTVELTTLPPPAGIPDPPNVTPCSATDPDSAPYFLYNADCKVRIRARVEFGSLGNPRAVRVNGNANCTSGVDLELRDGWWESTWLPTIDKGSRRNGFGLCWKVGNGPSSPHGNWGGEMMQMAYAANPSVSNGSGPLVYVSVRSPSTGCTEYANALDVTMQTVCIKVGLQPPLRIRDGNDPPLFLRVAGSGSLNQMLDCDASPIGPDEEIGEGCLTPHKVNTRDLACAPNPTYTPSNLPLPLPPPDPDPWPDCIEANPGDVTSMSKGLRARFEDPEPQGAGCPENRWEQYRDAGVVPPPTDPRYVTLVIAEYGTFDDSGIKVLPITKFAGFYVTGWFTKNGGQMAQGCPQNDPPPTPPFCSGGPCDPDDTKVQGAVWGYFIVQVFPSPLAQSDEDCEFDELGVCAAYLVE
jgi:Putative Flp pilus-assembly TadE/G-like